MINVKVGDMIWVEQKGPPQNFGYGEVINVWNDPEGNQWFDFLCEVNGGFRSGMSSKIIEKPTNRMMSKMLEEKAGLAKVLKEKG